MVERTPVEAGLEARLPARGYALENDHISGVAGRHRAEENGRSRGASVMYKTFRDELPEGTLAELLQPSLRSPKVRYRDLAVDDPDLRRRLVAAVDDVLRDGRLLMG